MKSVLFIYECKEKYMKKILLASAITFGICLTAGSASAHDSTGCGLGSMVWKGQSGPAPQILAVTTNGTFGSQTFGITSGSSGCDPNGRISGGTGKLLFVFLENNMDQYAFDASRGQGETLETIAGIMNVSVEKVATLSQEHFSELFPSQDTEVLHVASTLMEIIKTEG